MPDPSGILLVDKHAGTTSRRAAEAAGRAFGPVRARRRGGLRFRVGHAGTLDPLATGLLVVLIGRGTRLQPFLQGLDKRYTATVRLGAATDSHDRDGKITARAEAPAVRPDPAALAGLAARFTGDLDQVPPVISALKRDGRSLHALVRSGRAPEAPASRRVRIDGLELVTGRWGDEAPSDDPGHAAADGRLYELQLDLACGPGTYVRSLARDLADALGTVGHVHALRRLRVGPFDVADALAPDAPPDRLRANLLPLAAALPHAAAVTLDADLAAAVRQGAQPDPAWLPAPAPALFRLLDEAGGLAAVGRRDPETGHPVLAAVFPADGAPPEDDPCA